MRYAALALLVSALCACSTTPTLTPREYLDEQTTATITIVAEPVIFIAAPTEPEAVTPGRNVHFDQVTHGQDYFGLYGLDVNRMGEHRQYLAVQKWLVPEESAGVLPTLVLRVGSETLEFQASSDDARKLGIAQPLAPAYSHGSKWWYFPTDAATLHRIAGAQDLAATLTLADSHTEYTVFSDGRAQLGELAQALAP